MFYPNYTSSFTRIRKDSSVYIYAVMKLSFPVLLQIYHPNTVRVYTAGRLINSASNLSKDFLIALTAQYTSTVFSRRLRLLTCVKSKTDRQNKRSKTPLGSSFSWLLFRYLPTKKCGLSKFLVSLNDILTLYWLKLLKIRPRQVYGMSESTKQSLLST